MSNEEIIAEIRRRPDCCRDLIGTLWQQNEGLVRKVCRKYAGLDEPEDIMQEAFLAMWQAVQGFDPAEGVKFTTYLYSAIERHVFRYLDRNGSHVVPAKVRHRQQKYRAFLEEFWKQHGRKPKPEEIRKAIGLSNNDIEAFETGRFNVQMISLDTPVDTSDTEAATLSEIIPDARNDFSSVEEDLYHQQLSSCLWSLVDDLPDKQPELIRARYQDGFTLEAAGTICGLTKEKARREEGKAIRALRYGQNYKKLEPFYETIRSAGMKGTGAAQFSRTWTSSTEREALRLCSE